MYRHRNLNAQSVQIYELFNSAKNGRADAAVHYSSLGVSRESGPATVSHQATGAQNSTC